MAIQWAPTSFAVFIGRWNQGNHIGWTGAFANTTAFRQTQVATRANWDEFTKDTYLCSYKTGDWSIPGSENYTFLEGYQNIRSPPRDVVEPSWSVLAAYHTGLGKRLIVDGMHRAFKTEADYASKGAAREIGVIECIGPQVDATFPYDFRPLIARFSPR